MLFNSFTFLYFYIAIFICYWVLFRNSTRIQNYLLVIGSYIFYGWWDWRFLCLIFFSSILDYFIAQRLYISTSKRDKQILLVLSLSINLGLLGFFKYYNFFIENFVIAMDSVGFQSHLSSLNIILPVGVSFYTFQTISYSIDVYRDKLKPTHNIIAFLAYVSFFPQLVAGPIERATNLLPQFLNKRTFSYQNSIDGLRQALWGFFKKIVIADNCAQIANQIFNNSQDYEGWTLFLGAVFFSFQIYGDFSGYSDIAIGIAKVLGFDLMTNFRSPYFSRNIGEFWRRWHISLSTWFRDYVYIPLGGSQLGRLISIRNIFIIFLVSGFWHGANWTFIAWGGLNAIYFLPSFFTRKNRKYLNSSVKLSDAISILTTYILVVLAWILFRSNSISQALDIYISIFNQLISFYSIKHAVAMLYYETNYIIVLLIIFVLIEWFGRNYQYSLQAITNIHNPIIRRLFYAFLISLIGLYYVPEGTPFIYFQF